MGTAACHDADEHADSPGTAPRKRRLKPLVIGIAIVVVVALAATAAVLIVAKGFTEQEKQVRSDWTVETGDMLKRNDELAVTVYDADVDSALRVIRIVPDEQDDDAFTYYDMAVQDRLADAITDIQTCGIEWTAEGLGLDRILFADDDIVVCSSAHGLARIDGLGRVVRTYPLGGYELNHDINYGPDNTVVALAEAPGRTTVEDLVIEVDLETGAVTELVDFSELMADYKDAYTHVIGATDTFFWQAGEWDWIHLNTVEYLPGEDSLIVSSRETSAIIKVTDVHGEPAVSYLIGDESVWDGTAYEDLVYEQVGTFTPQYGQHSVEYDGAGPEEGAYYLLMYNNNYWTLSTRDDFEPDLAGTDVSRDLYNGTASYVYRYLVDENAGTYELIASFAVPYSSIVSNVAHAPAGTNYVVNSGIDNTFGEYDESGELIREFSYTCTLQGYRVFKHDFAGFWFAG